jgi:hypothetical protein
MFKIAQTIILGGLLIGTAYAADDKDALIKDALSAASPEIAKTAAVMGWDHSVLKKGTGAYTCMPTPPEVTAKGGREPMCLDKIWAAWGDAWKNKKAFKAEGVGIAYMLAGDTGASNIDPYAKGQTADNQWVVEGPHLMVLVPDTAQMESLPTDAHTGGPYVMWKGTPYAHIMVPVADRPTK